MRKLTIFMLLFLFLSGCGMEFLVSPIVAGVVRWIEGEAHKYYNYDSETLYRAVKHAAKELNYEIQDDKKLENGNYKVVVGENDRFKISIDRVENNVTRVSIRINIMGDKPYAELFYEKIDEQVNIIEFDINGIPIKDENISTIL